MLVRNSDSSAQLRGRGDRSRTKHSWRRFDKRARY